jgi:hypothetical protein
MTDHEDTAAEQRRHSETDEAQRARAILTEHAAAAIAAAHEVYEAHRATIAANVYSAAKPTNWPK